MKTVCFGVAMGVLSLSLCANVMAQTGDDWDVPQEETTPSQDEGMPAPAAEESTVQPADHSQDGAIGASTQPQTSSGDPLAEASDVGYHSAGLRFRWIFIPKWFITMFGVDIASQQTSRPLISNFGFGAEYTYRKDNFDITAAIWGTQLDWETPIYFKGSSEPDQSWTEVKNGLSALLFTADFIWSTPIRNWVAITYGLGLGFGIPLGGDIVETEAYIQPDGRMAPCNGPGNPDSNFCESDGEYNETYDKLKVVPWINFLVGARFKPHEHVAIYVDGGFGLGFQMGVRAGYIF